MEFEFPRSGDETIPESNVVDVLTLLVKYLIWPYIIKSPYTYASLFT